MKTTRSMTFARTSLALAALLLPLGAIAANAAAPKPPAALQATQTKQALTMEGARLAIAAAVQRARALKTTGVVAIVDDGGNLVAVERIDGTFSAGANISIGKARTAALFKKPTRAFEEIIKNGRTPMVALSDFTPLQGGIPLVSGGQVVGGIGVSGAASAAQDEELAIAGAAALATSEPDKKLLGTFLPSAPAAQKSPPSRVELLRKSTVTAAFERGAPLLETDHFKIHASRREAPGLAEVHTRDADIAYVQQGSATLVTGGALVNSKTIAPDELRGDSIRGGQTYELAPGDVVVIPAGVPHWFKRVSKPFTYYVVKVP